MLGVGLGLGLGLGFTQEGADGGEYSWDSPV